MSAVEPQLRIAFDGRVIKNKKSGIGVYAESLLNALTEISGCRYKIFTNDSIQFDSNKLQTIKTNISFENHPVGDIWEHLCLPFFLKREGVDIFHSPTFHLPFFSPGVKKVVTIHDLVSFRYPETQPTGFAVYSKLMTKLAVKSADAVIVPSKAIESELLTMLNIKKRVHVIHEAPRKIFKVLDDQEKTTEIRKKYRIPDDFILFVGSVEPRKNLSSLLYAFASLKKGEKILHKLVICGGTGWLNEYEKLLNIINETGIIGDVIFTGYVPDEDLPALYNRAALFVYPSIYEGFGLPPLEAMACGCPVVASNASSLPEVIGDAGLLVTPLNTEELTKALREALTSENLRKILSDKGLRRAAVFSWEKAAQETMKIYNELLT